MPGCHRRAASPQPNQPRGGTVGEAAAVLEEALLMAWACGGPRATTAVVDARRGDVAQAIARQASAWPEDLIVLARRPRPALAAWPGAASRPGHAPSGLPGARRPPRHTGRDLAGHELADALAMTGQDPS